VPPIFFDHLTIREGLSHNTVHCLLQDQYGYVWIGTQNGLNKYDGYGFEIYRSGESTDPGFSGKTITALFEDAKGNLWVGTEKAGINFRESGKDAFTNIKFEEIERAGVSSFAEDNDGNIWMTTIGAGVLKYEVRTKTSQIFNEQNSNLSSNHSFSVLETGDKEICVAAAGPGLNYLQPNGQFEHRYSPPQDNVNGYRKQLYKDNDGFWVATEGTGVFQIKANSQTRFAPGDGDFPLSSHICRDVIRASDGLVYMATDGDGLNVYDEEKGVVHSYRSILEAPTSLNSNALYSLLEDRTGNIWIGTYNGGVNLIKKNKTWFEFYTAGSVQNNSLQKPSILSIAQTVNGNIWVGTDGGGVNLLNQDNGRVSFSIYMNDPQYPTTIAGNAVKTIFEDSKNRIWLGVFGAGLDRFDPNTGVFKHYSYSSYGSNTIWGIAERKDGKFWIATLDQGLLIFDSETESFEKFSGGEALDGQPIMAVFADENDNLWLGTDNNGLFFREEGTGLNHYKNDPKDSTSISSNEVRAIFQDSKNTIWIGTESGGLNKYLGDQKFQSITKQDGLIANSVMGITEDHSGLLWISSYEGISQLNTETGEIRNFNFHTGQNSNQFNQMSSLTAQDGKLYFGGINGLNAIAPESVKAANSNSSIVFTDLKIFNKSIRSGKMADGRTILKKPIESAEEINLQYGDNSFSIEFSVLDFKTSTENLFFYKMEGFDLDWQTSGVGMHSASYTNLDPGEFVFKVKNGSEESSIKVNIKPPFWKTIWFRIFMFLLAFVLIIGGFLFVFYRQKEAYNREMMKAESEILQLKNEKLETEVEIKNSKLMFSSVQMAHKKEILTNIKEEMAQTKDDPNKLRQVLRMLDKELEGEDYWKEFNLYFDKVDKQFIKSIKKQKPKLTQNDLRLCSLIRLNLSTKEIASLLNVSVRGVEQSRYRLKKRLNLESGQDLVEYISEFE